MGNNVSVQSKPQQSLSKGSAHYSPPKEDNPPTDKKKPEPSRLNEDVLQSSFLQSRITPDAFSRFEPDSTFTQLTDYSQFSFQAKDNDYIMAVPELDSPSPALHELRTTQEIVEYFARHPSDTFDTLVTLFSSARMKESVDLQQHTFRACEQWIARANDPSAKASDKKKACEWYRKTFVSPGSTGTTAPYFIAQARVCAATIQLLAGESLEENLALIRQSAEAGNKVAEFQLGYLIYLGVANDTKTTRDYFTQSAHKSFSPAQIQLALILLKEGRVDEGLQWLKKATELNNPQAYYQLGNIYELGSFGIKSNFELAYSNYYHAAEQYSHRPSEFRLGMNYLIGGLGLVKDTERAFEFIQSAAVAGDPGAQYVLGVMYREGEIPQMDRTVHGMARNKKEAFQWFRRAAAQNLPAAITQMALCYEQGVGVSVNNEVANQYYERAVQFSDRYKASAQVAYARFLCSQKKYKQGFDYYLQASGLVQPNMTSPQVAAEAKRMVAIFYLDNSKDSGIPYKPKEGFDLLMELAVIDPNNGSVHYWLANCYENGIQNVCPKSPSRSHKHYSNAAKLGYADAQLHMGHLLFKGTEVQQNRRAAFEWFMKAAEQKSPKALNYIGLYYYKGTFGIPKDDDKAREFFKKSAQLGEVDGMISYAQLCQEKARTMDSEQQIKKLQKASFDWYKKASLQGHPKALRELGRLYASGLGTEKNPQLSFEHLKLAADKHDPLANLLLGGCYENGFTQDLHTALSYYLKAIQLGQPTALLAAAEVYEKLEQYEKAYDYYGRVIEDGRVSKSYKSSRISRLKRSLYELGYNPTLLNQPMTSDLKFPQKTIPSNPQAFQTIYMLATQDYFLDAFVWLAECYQDGNGVSQSMSDSIYWRTKAAEESNDAYSLRKLVYVYEQGLYVPKDLNLSQKYRNALISRQQTL
ncbi:hypothetical protein BY458DRAFT_523125 [Sporodiniella umbellata]|nr:hypothetical protein BY458DRAFT_523125 [Sporodiniella umbellata]